MIRMLLIFMLLFVVFFVGIPTFRNLTKTEKWSLTKLIGYSIMCSGLAVLVMTFIVIVF